MADDLVERARERLWADDIIGELADRIEKLEVVLRTYACNCGLERDWLCEDRETSSECGYRANKVLEELK